MYLKNTKSRYQYLLKISERTIPKGCPTDEIDNLSNSLELKLPQSYREFLEWMGKSGGCFGGDYCDVKRVLTFNRKYCLAMLRQYNQLDSFPNDSIFVIVYQGGYGFEFMCASEGDNPSVHRVMETESGSVEITWNYAENLESLCLDAIEDLIKAYEK